MVPLDLLVGLVQFISVQYGFQQVCTVSFSGFPRSGLRAPAYPSRSTLSFCGQPFRYSAFFTPSSFLRLLKTYDCSALPEKKLPVLWLRLRVCPSHPLSAKNELQQWIGEGTSHSKLYSAFGFPTGVRETSPGKDDILCFM